MPSRQRREPSQQAASGGSESVAWSAQLAQDSNQDLIALLTGAEVDAAEADQALGGESLLDRAGGALSSAPRGPTAGARPRGGKLESVYDDNKKANQAMKVSLTSSQADDVAAFRRHYTKHAQRYATVSGKTGVPAKLIAAIHWRESSGDFGTYLHQGDPLGKKAVNVPKNIPLFHKWEPAAEHALNMKKGHRDAVQLQQDPGDKAAIATYAEAYNGLGYHDRDLPSAYVYAGTNQYQAGKYVSDGVFSKTAVDEQVGVMALMEGLEGNAAPKADPRAAWRPVVAGATVLKQGQDGEAVRYLQQRLVVHGAQLSPDGDFGPGTTKAVKAFQRGQRLEDDGVVGNGTAAALDRPPSRRSS